DVVARDPGRREDRTDRGHGGRPPERRILLAPARPRDVVAVFGDADARGGPGATDEDGLGRRRRDVDPEDVAHSGARSAAQMSWLTMCSSSSWRPDTGLGSISPEKTRPARISIGAPPARIDLPSSPVQPA